MSDHAPDPKCRCYECVRHGRNIRERYRIKGGLGGMMQPTPDRPHPDAAFIPELGGESNE